MMTAKAATARSHIGLRGVGSSAIAGAVPVAGVTLVVNGRLVPPARVTPLTGLCPTSGSTLGGSAEVNAAARPISLSSFNRHRYQSQVSACLVHEHQATYLVI